MLIHLSNPPPPPLVLFICKTTFEGCVAHGTYTSFGHPWKKYTPTFDPNLMKHVLSFLIIARYAFELLKYIEKKNMNQPIFAKKKNHYAKTWLSLLHSYDYTIK
jgi:hypothetical protein